MALIPPSTSDRFRAAFLGLVKSVMPNLLYLGTYEYRVVTSSAPAAPQSMPTGITWVVSAVPADPAVAKVLPPLANITMWPGPVWGFSQPTPGSLVRIQFVNGDPSKAAIVGLDPSTPSPTVSIGSPVALPLAMAAPILTLNAAIQTWVGALTTALSGSSTPAQVATAMATPNATLVTAIGAANTATPTKVVNAL